MNLLEKDPSEMDQSELNDLFFFLINALTENAEKHGASIASLNERLDEVRDVFSMYDTVITELQEAVVELRTQLDTMRNAENKLQGITGMSTGGILLTQ